MQEPQSNIFTSSRVFPYGLSVLRVAGNEMRKVVLVDLVGIGW